MPALWFWVAWEVVGGVLVAFGCIGEWYLFKHPAEHTNQSKHRARELKFITAVAIGVTMELLALSHSIPEAIRLEHDVATANEHAALAASNSAALAQQLFDQAQAIVQTKASVANIHPINLPIKSMTAQVYLEVFRTNSPPSPQVEEETAKFAGRFDILDKSGGLIASLACIAYEVSTRIHPDPDHPRTALSMLFIWPHTEKPMLSAKPEQIARTDFSTKQLDQLMASGEIWTPSSKAHLPVNLGSCTLTINGQIQREFSVPRFTDELLAVRTNSL